MNRSRGSVLVDSQGYRLSTDMDEVGESYCYSSSLVYMCELSR